MVRPFVPFLALAIEVVHSAVAVVMRVVAHGELVDMSSSLWGAVQRGRNANGFRAIVSGSVSVIETYAECSTRFPQSLTRLVLLSGVIAPLTLSFGSPQLPSSLVLSLSEFYDVAASDSLGSFSSY